MKKLRKKGSKKKERKQAQKRLHQVTEMVTAAKQCHACEADFDPKRDLDWHIMVTPARELRLTCTACNAPTT